MSTPIAFGNYFLLDRINTGGMAEVFRAKTCCAEGVQRLLAVKRILDNIAEHRDFIEMFVNEAKIAVQLNHANIGQIYELGEVRGSYYIAMEYIHGKDLRTVFERGEDLKVTLPVPQACFVVMKVCEGLDYAHNKRGSDGRPMQLVHRDVSPQNVLLSYEGDVKLIDFGVAKAAGNMSRTEAGVLKGKFPYMSPEQVRGLPLDKRSDIFSVGVILFELLTGKRLFAGETDFATLEHVRKANVPSPRGLNPEVPESLEQIVMRALARDADDRYQSAIDLHDDLQAFLYSVGAFGGQKELSAWLAQCFAKEIEQEAALLAGYENVELPDSGISATQPGGSPAQVVSLVRSETPGDWAPPSEPDPLSWMAEDAETGIFDDDRGGPDGAPSSLGDPSTRGQGTAGESEHDVVADSAAATRQAPDRPAWRRDRRLMAVLIAAIVIGAVSAVAAFYLLDLRGSRRRVLRVHSEPRGARVALNGEVQSGVTPLVLRNLKAGRYDVSLSKDGYRLWERRLDVAGQSQATVSARLEPQQGKATIDLRTQPGGATVYLDGRKLKDVTPLRILDVAPGHHSLEIRNGRSFTPLGRTVEVLPRRKLSLSYVLRPRGTAEAKETQAGSLQADLPTGPKER